MSGSCTQCRSEGLSILYSLCIILFPLHLHTNIQRSTVFNQRKTDSSKLLRAADLIVQFSKFQIIKQGHAYSQAQFSASFGKETMTRQDCRMTQSMLAVDAIQIWRIFNSPQWSSEGKLLPGLFWGSLGWLTLITHGQSGHCSWLIQQIIMHDRKKTHFRNNLGLNNLLINPLSLREKRLTQGQTQTMALVLDAH